MPSTRSRTVSNACAGLLILFAAFCLQGHLTTTLTPSFAAQIAASIRPHNEKVFYPLGLDDRQLNLMMAAINVVDMSSFLVSRELGFVANAAFYTLGFYATGRIGESVAVHVVMISAAVVGWLTT